MRTVVLACWILAYASSARAQSAAEPMRGVTMPPRARARISATWETVFHTGSNTIFEPYGVSFPDTRTYTAWSNVLTVDVDSGDVLLRAAIPLTYEVVGALGATRDQAELGDIALEGLANVPLGVREHRLLIGGGAALPTATDQTSGTQIRLVAWESSFRNAQLWVDQAVSIWPTIDYRFAIPWLWVGAVVTVPVFFPLAGNGGPQPLARGVVEVMVQVDASVALRVLDVVDVGLSFLAWAVPSGAGYSPWYGMWLDLAQTALTLSVRSDPLLDSPIFGGAEMIFDLDNRWGPTGAPGKLWGLHAFFGGRFDL